MPLLQSIVQFGRRFVSRGWAPLIKFAAQINPKLRRYSAQLNNGDSLLIDLTQPMCMGYFFDGGVPHNQGLDRLMRHTLKPGGVFVDVGANIGYYTKLARNLVGPSGKVHAFEPLPTAFPLLFANALGSGHMELGKAAACVFVGHNGNENVTVHTLAVGAQQGELDFYEQTAGDTSSLAPSENARRVRVGVTTLDIALKDLHRLDLLKIDVEGFEFEVFQGALETLKRFQPVIEFEFLEGYSKARKLTLENYRSLLAPLGYRLFWSNHSETAALAVSSPPSSDVIAIPPLWMERIAPDKN